MRTSDSHGVRWLRWSLAALLPALVLAALLCFRTGTGLHGVHLAMATGIPEAESSRAVDQIGRVATGLGATIERRTTAGPAEAVAAVRAGDVQFCVVPVGCAPSLDGLELVARLPVHVPFLLIGPRAQPIDRLASLAGKRIAVGPAGSATATVAERLLGSPAVAALGVHLLPGPVAAGGERLARGEVDLVALLATVDSPLVRAALGTDGELFSLAEIEAMQELMPFARSAVVPASRIDLARGIPGADRRVLEFELGVLCGPATRRSAVVQMLRVLHRTFPGLVAANQAGTDDAAAPTHDLAASYFAAGGAGFVDTHLPIVHDLMPWSRLAQIALVLGFAVQLLDRLRRYQLGRLVVEFRRLGAAVAKAAGMAAVEVPLSVVDSIPGGTGSQATVDGLIAAYDQLGARARRLSESWLAPMEGESGARAIELLSTEWALSLRGVRTRSAVR